MFVSHKYMSSSATFNKHDRKHTYKLIDSDFEEEIKIRYTDINDGPKVRTEFMNAIITIYEQRKLNVAANIIKVLQYQCKEYDIDMNTAMTYVENEEYKEQIKKYLPLL